MHTDPNDNTEREFLSAKSKFEKFNEEKAKGTFIRSRAKWVEDSEKCTSYFLQLEKRNYNTKYIKTLHTETSTITDPGEILMEQELFYKTLYTAKPNNSRKGENCPLFMTQGSKLNQEQSDKCDLPITITECAKSLKELQNNKTPGSDGFTTEYYKLFWSNIKNYVFESFEYSFKMVNFHQSKGEQC